MVGLHGWPSIFLGCFVIHHTHESNMNFSADCEDYHWGDPTTGECRRCECDPIGSATQQCDRINGSCVCLPGSGGERNSGHVKISDQFPAFNEYYSNSLCAGN